MQPTEIRTVEGKDLNGLSPDTPIPVAFAGPHDPENPQGWSSLKRWRVLLVALTVSYTSAFNASSVGATSGGFREDHPGVSAYTYQLTGFAFLFMLGVGPLALAPISEQWGRRPMLAGLTLIITILFLPQALAPNVESIIITRFVQGLMACIEGPVAAGVVADLTTKANRGVMMGTFVLSIFAANATGPLVANWVAQTRGWELVFWIQMASNGACWLSCVFLFPETRGDVILARKARALTQSTGRQHYVAGLDVHASWGQAIKTSLSRPLIYLFTEPIVTALSLWVGFAWGTVFLFISAISIVFKETYGFSQGQAGTVLITGFIGAFISWLWNIFGQERIYQNALKRGGGTTNPEVRLYSASVGGILFSIGCFGFGWSARPWIHWIVPCICIVIANIGIYSVYLSTYSYLGDTYSRYSSSAQASQSLLRNVLGGVLPFATSSLYHNMGFPVASTIIGAIAAAFAVVPFLVIRYGPTLRARSSIAVALELEEGNVLPEEPVQDKVQVV